MTLTGIPAVLIAAYVVKSVPLAGLRWLVVIPNKRRLKATAAISATERLRVSFREWPEFVMRDHGYGAIEIEAYRGMLPFAEKWRIAAEIWHTQRERDELVAFLGDVLSGTDTVLDAAAGTGFHCEILRSLGKRVTALEVSAAELKMLTRSPRGLDVTPLEGDWRALPSALGERQFDGVVCLGSSIPYHSSWNDSRGGDGNGIDPGAGQARRTEDQDHVLRNVIANLRAALNSHGVLVIGLSRHNEKSRAGVDVEYVGTVDGIEYKMAWKFGFDWSTRARAWNAVILSADEAYGFEIVGHLFDHEELASICREHFAKVEVRDIDPLHYDKYLVCRNPK